MRRHSQWAVAAGTAALTVVLASHADARTHRRAHGDTHPATGPAAPPSPMPSTTAPPQSPAAGLRSNDQASTPPPAVADAGKGGMSSAAIDPRDVEVILGKSVRSSAGEDMGRLVDVVVDREGRPRAAIIDFGGFLGVGSRKIAVDWGVLKFAHDKDKGDVITVQLTRDEVKGAPEFKEGSQLVVLGPSGTPTPATPPQAQDKPQAQEK
jgi:PRC-barrel domain